MVKRIAYRMYCDNGDCTKEGSTVYATEGYAPPVVEQVHQCDGGKRRRLRNYKMERK